MTEAKKPAKQKLHEAQLAELEAKIDVAKAKLAQARASTSIEIDEQLEGLHKKRRAMSERLEELRDATEGAWEEASHGLDSAWEELKQAYEDFADGISAAVTRFKGTGH